MKRKTAKGFSYGGQAVIEGVMMRGRGNMAISVRRPDGQLETRREPLAKIYRGRLRGSPLVRGVIVLIETLVLGIHSLLYSAQIATAEEEEQIPALALWGIAAASIAFAAALFFVAPLLIARLLDTYVASDFVSNLLEGFVRIGIFVGYLKVIGLFPDIRRVFAYHGAEHKVVNAYENGCPLEVEAVKGYSTAHARCGTSFIFAVLVISILVFALLGRPPIWVSIASRIVLLPVIAAIGYEVTKFGASHSKSILSQILLAPGLTLQAMTTREPDGGQLEAAISALKEVVEADSSEEKEEKGN